MMKQLLFVTASNEDFADGFSYAVDLARAMKEDITILLVQKKNLMKKFEDMMTAITFAEAGEHETAREILAEGKINRGENTDKELEHLIKRSREAGINVDAETVSSDAVSAVKDFLKRKNGVDMVLLSPSITSNGDITSKELNRLVRTASKPIVTMTKHAYAQ